jgi:hypothetical protein
VSWLSDSLTAQLPNVAILKLIIISSYFLLHAFPLLSIFTSSLNLNDRRYLTAASLTSLEQHLAPLCLSPLWICGETQTFQIQHVSSFNSNWKFSAGTRLYCDIPPHRPKSTLLPQTGFPLFLGLLTAKCSAVQCNAQLSSAQLTKCNIGRLLRRVVVAPRTGQQPCGLFPHRHHFHSAQITQILHMQNAAAGRDLGRLRTVSFFQSGDLPGTVCTDATG